ncbi:MAG: hypothetical protein ACTSQI_00270 [Candidatus Helarchaeota archaeon]
MDKSLRQDLFRFCRADALKSATLNIMQIGLRYQDYLTQKKEAPDAKTLFSWILNQLNNEITRAASSSASKSLIEAQNYVAEAIQKFEASDQIPNFPEIIDMLRTAVTKITSEAANMAKVLKL